MARARRVRAATVVAAALVVCCVCVAAGPARAGDGSGQFLLFSGADLWRDGRFLYGGLLWSPGGLENEGFTLQGFGSGGIYRYRSGALADTDGVRPGNRDAAAAGLALQARPARAQGLCRARHQARRTIPTIHRTVCRARSLGVRGAVNLWFEPTPSTMLSGRRFAHLDRHRLYGALAYGWRRRIGSISARRRKPSPASATARSLWRSSDRHQHRRLGMVGGGRLADDSDRRASPYLLRRADGVIPR